MGGGGGLKLGWLGFMGVAVSNGNKTNLAFNLIGVEIELGNKSC